MKKLFLLLATAFIFVACNDDELDMEYYSQLSPDELIATGEGVEYLVRAYGNVDQQAINDMLTTCAFNEVGIYWKGKNGWFAPDLIGYSPNVYIVMDECSMRLCFIHPAIGRTLKDGSQVRFFYRNLTYTDDPLSAIVARKHPNAQIVAHKDSVVVIQYTEEEYGRVNRVVYQILNNREELFQKYAYDIEDESLYID